MCKNDGQRLELAYVKYQYSDNQNFLFQVMKHIDQCHINSKIDASWYLQELK